jgi:AbiEi antitoxin C-terminal domain
MTPLTSSILARLERNDVVFTTARAAQLSDTSVQSAVRVLQDMAHSGLVTRVTRGVWAITRHPDFSPYAVLPFILGTHQEPQVGVVEEPWSTPIDDEAANRHASRAGYVSFVSALHLHGMLSQIPREIHVAVPRHRRPLDTPVAQFVFHRRMQTDGPATVPGDRWGRFALATPAQSLVDTMYISVHRGRRFAHLPEIELPSSMAWLQPRGRRVSESVQMARLFGEVDDLIAGIRRPETRQAVVARWRLLQESIRSAVVLAGE